MNSYIMVLAAVAMGVTGCTSPAANPPSQAATGAPQGQSPRAGASTNETDQLAETGKWRLPLPTSEASIAVNLLTSRVYAIGSALPPTAPFVISNINVKKEQAVLAINNTPLELNQGSFALVEAKTLSLVPAKGSTALTAGDYLTKVYEPNSEISFGWRINGNNGPILLADLVTPRNFRIFVKQANPVTATGTATAYLFAVMVDGVTLPNLLASNVTSVDVYGKQIALQLRQYPPAPAGQSFDVSGSCVSW